MARRIGIRGRKVVAVVNDNTQISSSSDIKYISVGPNLEHLSDRDLFEKVVVRNGVPCISGEPKPVSELRIACVGAWGIPCGISTYAEALWPRMWEKVADWRLFPEANTCQPTTNIIPGLWKRGESLSALAKAIEDFQPDAVFIQHEYGIFPDARHWLSFIARIREFRPIVTMHSVYHHKDKTVIENSIPEIVVHSRLAKDVLVQEKGIKSKVTVIKHGCGPSAASRLWNLYRSEHTFMQFGFGFRYKNWEAPIRAAAILKHNYPDVFFTGLFSEGMFSKLEHDRYYDELMKLAFELGVEDHIAILRGYVSESCLNAYLGTNQVAVFPYLSDPDHVVYGASGASRRAMEAQIPVIVSREPHFCDLDGICPQAESPEALAHELAILFENPNLKAKLIEDQNRFLTENSWGKAGDLHLDLVSKP